MRGKISLVTGPMFSGKSNWLIKELRKKNSNEILAVKYFLDNRYAIGSISTHDGKKIKAQSVKSENGILKFLKENPNVTTVGIDELQFFKPSISDLLVSLKKKNIIVLTAGLNVDHNNKEWETTKKVKAISDVVRKLEAICAVCGKKNATITNRKGRRNERIVIGGAELYESLCEKDYKRITSL